MSRGDFDVQVTFVSVCRSFWDCGSVALDDVTVSLGDCEQTAGNKYNKYTLTDIHTRVSV